MDHQVVLDKPMQLLEKLFHIAVMMMVMTLDVLTLRY